jgi:ABC-2 type transport system permease protein
MHKVWLVIKREYVTRVRTKGFVITTILIPALLIGFIAFDMAVSGPNPSQTLRIAIVDGGQGVAASVAASLEKNKLPDGKPAYEVTRILNQSGTRGAVRPVLEAQVRSGRLDGFIWIPPETSSGMKPQFVTKSATVFTQMDAMNEAVSEAVLLRRLQGQGISAQDLGRLLHGADIRVIRLTRRGETEEKGQSLIIAGVMAMILYITLVAYGVRTMRSVQEEKTSRIMEVLLSSIQPLQLLAGKILGVAAVGLTQFLIWAISAGLLSAYGLTVAHELNPGASQFSIHIPPALLAFMIVYFIGGYFLYSSIYATIGAMVSSEQDAQQLQMPVTMLLVVGILLFQVVMRDPNSSASVALSIIPFWSPMLMLMRVGLQQPPVWQIGLSLGVLALTVACVVYITARIYRVGVLMYGKRPSLVELARWFRYS